MDLFPNSLLVLPFASQIFLVVIFGAIFGSFASLLSHRFATKEAVVFTRSQCPKCHVVLKFYNLVPIFSWLFQRGKCNNCHQKISPRYPLIELTTVVSFVTIFLYSGQKFDYRFILLCLVAFDLIIMSVTDIEHYFIPDFTQYFLAILLIILRISDDGTYGAINNIKSAFAYLGFGLLLLAFYYITTKIEAIGIDDLKFFFIAGLGLGMQNFLFFMLLGGILGTIFGVAWQQIKQDRTFPFGPPICFALYVCLLFGNKVDPIAMFGELIF